MSRGLTHLIGGLVAVVCGLGGFALVAIGGQRLLQAYMRLDLGSTVAVTGVGLQIAGTALLVLAVLTARWTPVGLLCLGTLSLATLAASAFPLALYSAAANLPAIASSPLNLTLVGVPQVLGAVMGGVGLALLLRQDGRRSLRTGPADSRPSASGAGTHVIAAVAAPILFVPGLLVLLRGVSGAMRSVQMLMESNPLWLIAIAGGLVLLLAACFTVRWSPFSLILPALIVAVFTAVSFLPRTFGDVLEVTVQGLGTFLVLGGIPTVVVLAACSFVAVSHWSRDRRTARTAAPVFQPTPGTAR